MRKIIIFTAFVQFLVLVSFVSVSSADSIPVPSIQVGFADSSQPEEVATTIKILVLLTILTLAPSILILMTSFTRIMIVFSFLRHAMHTQQMPSNQILVGLALFMTFCIMTPVWNDINESAVRPYMDERISFQQAIEEATVPLKDFMLKQTREKDLALMLSLTKEPRPRSKEDLPFTAVVPAFVISEVTTAFSMGFIIFLPFLIIDMVVACTLLSMGMMMLPPVMVSLPFKLLLFVLADGWNLVVGSIVKSFH